jgi:hypothetical protein
MTRSSVEAGDHIRRKSEAMPIGGGGMCKKAGENLSRGKRIGNFKGEYCYGLHNSLCLPKICMLKFNLQCH